MSDDPHGLKQAQANPVQEPYYSLNGHNSPTKSNSNPNPNTHSRYYSISNATTMQAEHTHLNKDVDPAYALSQIRSAGSVSMSPELFEKLYLGPQTRVQGELRRTFANPTPIAIIGHVIALGPLSCDLMGWRGAPASGIASIAVYFFFGGLMMFVGGVLEWMVGNTFPATVFTSFGAFWLAWGGTLNPSFAAYSSYAPEGSPPIAGMTSPGFQSSLGFFFISMGILTIVYLICALRTNICYCLIFLTLTVAFGLFTTIYFMGADRLNPDMVHTLTVGAGAVLFFTTAVSWYIISAILFEAMAFPFQLPVGDLSTRVFVSKRDRNEEDSV